MLMRELLSLYNADFSTTKDYLLHLRSLNDCITCTKIVAVWKTRICRRIEGLN
jgi:hypothetical protein